MKKIIKFIYEKNSIEYFEMDSIISVLFNLESISVTLLLLDGTERTRNYPNITELSKDHVIFENFLQKEGGVFEIPPPFLSSV